MPARLPGPEAIVDVQSGERDGPLWKLKLACGHTTWLKLRAKNHPPKARCQKCPPTACGATNNDGGTCEFAPKHKDVWHEREGRKWLYDARQPAGSTTITAERQRRGAPLEARKHD